MLWAWGGTHKEGPALLGARMAVPWESPAWGCTAGHSDSSKYLYNVVPVHPQGGGRSQSS